MSDNQWSNIEVNIRRIGNGFTASVSAFKNYPERRSPETYFQTLSEAVSHCAALIQDEDQMAELLASGDENLGDMPF